VFTIWDGEALIEAHQRLKLISVEAREALDLTILLEGMLDKLILLDSRVITLALSKIIIINQSVGWEDGFFSVMGVGPICRKVFDVVGGVSIFLSTNLNGAFISWMIFIHIASINRKRCLAERAVHKIQIPVPDGKLTTGGAKGNMA